jgi:sulfite reductase (ferredoxin)
LRFSLKQNIVVRNIRESLALSRISQIRLVTLGYDTINDITVQELIRNLGIASSTGIAEELERVLKLEFPQYKRIEKSLLKLVVV